MTVAVDLFTKENWQDGERLREAAGYFGTTTITLIDGVYRVRFGSPDTGGAEKDFAELADAIEWANNDAGGIRLLLDEEGEIGTIEVYDDPATRPADASLGPSSEIEVSASNTAKGQQPKDPRLR